MISTAVAGLTTPCAGQTRRRTGPASVPAAARHAASKAVFEPVAFPFDGEIDDVFFIGPDTGWVSGRGRAGARDGGFIAATRDGGQHWALQLGGSNPPAWAIVRLFFLDARHGWAEQIDGTLLRTTDGSTWTRIGAVVSLSPIAFITPETGFSFDGAQGIRVTADAGRTWRLAYECRAEVELMGAPSEQACVPQTIAFASDHRTGYVVARARDWQTAVVIKTTDGGQTWGQASVTTEMSRKDASLAFADPLTGYLRAGSALLRTLDGARTWQTMTATIPEGDPRIAVAGPVGWMIGSRHFSYTLDGGKRWLVRPVDFPSPVVKFTVLDAGTGYVVGHAMFYRYRIVPSGYAVPGMLAVPGMTTFVEGS